jgi:hypothetical protein
MSPEERKHRLDQKNSKKAAKKAKNERELRQDEASDVGSSRSELQYLDSSKVSELHEELCCLKNKLRGGDSAVEESFNTVEALKILEKICREVCLANGMGDGGGGVVAKSTSKDGRENTRRVNGFGGYLQECKPLKKHLNSSNERKRLMTKLYAAKEDRNTIQHTPGILYQASKGLGYCQIGVDLLNEVTSPAALDLIAEASIDSLRDMEAELINKEEELLLTSNTVANLRRQNNKLKRQADARAAAAASGGDDPSMEEVQQCVKELLPRLENNEPGLMDVNLQSKSLGDADAKALGLALRSNTTVTTLVLNYNQIGDQGAKDLADAVRHSTTMTWMNLRNNQIGDQGAKDLADGVRHSTTMTTLHLRYNQIGDQGAKDLAEGVRHSTTMTELALSGNQIGAELLQSIYALVATPGMRCGGALLT